MSSDISLFKVGSIVRAPRNAAEKPKGRAMIAMVQDDQTLCLLWEPCIPQPLHNSRFWVTPTLPVKATQDEVILESTKVQPLLDFEEDGRDAYGDMSSQHPTSDTALWKDRGDQLLRLGDPTSAILYYEMALHCSSKISVGSSVICTVQGYPKIAEIDCVDDDTVDVVFIESDKETTIPRSDILLAILSDDDNHWQTRILLNLVRCLLQQADIDVAHRAKYFKSAILATTLVLSILSFHDPETGNSTESAQTALQLRIKAQMGLSKWSHAMADSKRLIKLANPQGQKLWESIEREKKNQAKRDKKLVKAVSRWVQTATSESVSELECSGNKSGGGGGGLDKPTISSQRFSHDSDDKNDNSNNNYHNANSSTQLLFSSPLVILLVLTAAFLIQHLVAYS